MKKWYIDCWRNQRNVYKTQLAGCLEKLAGSWNNKYYFREYSDNDEKIVFIIPAISDIFRTTSQRND